MKSEWPPASPDTNPFDFYFWNAVKSNVYKGPWKNEKELQQKIKSEWNECASDEKLIRKAFKQIVPRLHAEVENKGHLIKMLYG